MYAAGHSPEPALQPGDIMLEIFPDAEIVIQHGVQDAPVQVPLQCFCQHELLSKTGYCDIQRQNTLLHKRTGSFTHKSS
jgi:hypothetical protein